MRCQPVRRRVYPRVCGGTHRRSHSRHCSTGLSPRVRGNPRSVFFNLYWLRSIPACAGEPPRAYPIAAAWRVYPRVCGGTLAAQPSPSDGPGLSPRVRGNPLTAIVTWRIDGSIPACAGEPLPVQHISRQGGVYPRVCGGTRHWTPSATSSSGLSPRVRGNPFRQIQNPAAPRSIPACAGEP